MDPSIGPVLFIGPVEILLLGLVLIVLLFGARAPEVAKRVGEAFGEFQKSKSQVEQEVSEVTNDFDEVREEVDQVRDDIGIEDDLQEIQEDVEQATSMDTGPNSEKDTQ